MGEGGVSCRKNICEQFDMTLKNYIKHTVKSISRDFSATDAQMQPGSFCQAEAIFSSETLVMPNALEQVL